MPLLSVAIPIYNNARYVRAAIESVLVQTFADFELILCDDGSTDGTQEIIRSIQDPRIILSINPKNLGIVGNFNRCVSLCTGEFITLFHNDDLMLPRNLEMKVLALRAHPQAGFVHSNFFVIDEKGDVIELPSNNQNSKSPDSIDYARGRIGVGMEKFNKGGHWSVMPAHDSVMSSSDCFQRLLFEENFICCPSVMIRRRCHEALGVYDERLPYTSDYEMWLRVSLACDSVYLAEPLIQYRLHQTNLTNTFQGKRKIVGQDQTRLAKRLALARFQGLTPRFTLDKKKLAGLYSEMGQFYFWTEEFKTAREMFRDGLRYGVFRLQTLAYYLLTFIPTGLLRILKKINKKLRKVA